MQSPLIILCRYIVVPPKTPASKLPTLQTYHQSLFNAEFSNHKKIPTWWSKIHLIFPFFFHIILYYILFTTFSSVVNNKQRTENVIFPNFTNAPTNRDAVQRKTRPYTTWSFHLKKVTALDCSDKKEDVVDKNFLKGKTVTALKYSFSMHISCES